MKRIMTVLITCLLLASMTSAAAIAIVPEIIFAYPPKLDDFQADFLFYLDQNSVILENTDFIASESDDDPPFVSYDCEPIAGANVSVTYQNDALISYYMSVPEADNYANVKLADLGLSFFMAACQLDRDQAYALFEYLTTSLEPAEYFGRQSEIQRDGYTASMGIAPTGMVSLVVYPDNI
ncbi:hypothetical protein SDC9_200745 [bioreactor metagenome]|uniref:Uncharacterized protein n=1 Tax=bioreactor metagenome TaxID=1076179 RepID=A0A645IP29_9ZZZZ